jgi:hypothetical protein
LDKAPKNSEINYEKRRKNFKKTPKNYEKLLQPKHIEQEQPFA